MPEIIKPSNYVLYFTSAYDGTHDINASIVACSWKLDPMNILEGLYHQFQEVKAKEGRRVRKMISRDGEKLAAPW